MEKAIDRSLECTRRSVKRNRWYGAPILNVGGAEGEVSDNPREKADVYISCDPSLAVSNAVVDDMGRVWQVQSTTRGGSRSFLVLDCILSIQ